MSYEVRTSEARPRVLAAIHREVRQAELSTHIREVLGQVWQFLWDTNVNSTGHNVILYDAFTGPENDRRLGAWFGVEVHEALPASDLVSETATPAGRVVATTHRGPYTELSGAYDAILQWCEANEERIGGACWEVYGDWTDDASQLRTDVYFKLAD